MNTRMKRDRFNIGLYGLDANKRTEKHIREIAECGLDFVLTTDSRPLLDLMHKYNLGVINMWFDPLPHWGGPGYGYVGRMEEKFPLERYIKPAETFKDHPAIWGLSMGDEPNSVDFPYIGTVVDAVNNAYPNQFPFLNLYPNYASVAQNTEDEVKSQLGAATYQEYIDKYCDYIPNHYISFDFYPYRGNAETRDYNRGGRISKFYENLRLVAESCRKTGRDLWIIIQGNHDEGGDEYAPPSVFMPINEVRFQTYSAMAFGVKTVMWWESWIFDLEGNKTEQYDVLKQVHKEVHTIAQEYMKYRNVSSHFVGFEQYPDLKMVKQNNETSLNTGVFFDVKSDNGSPLVIGQMVSDKDNAQALMVFAADDPIDRENRSYNITFRAGKKAISAIGGEGWIPVTKLEDGSYSVPISSNQGILIVAG